MKAYRHESSIENNLYTVFINKENVKRITYDHQAKTLHLYLKIDDDSIQNNNYIYYNVEEPLSFLSKITIDI